MALRWCRVTPAELAQWARELQTIASEMQTVAAAAAKASVPCVPAGQSIPPDKDAADADAAAKF
jgi:hypothetical protein